MLVYLCRAKLPLNGLALPVHHAPPATRVPRGAPFSFFFFFIFIFFNIPRRVITAAFIYKFLEGKKKQKV